METSVIPFSKEDFDTAAPYEYLYSIKNAFQRRLEIERLQKYAKTLGMSGVFARMWRDFLKGKAPSKDEYVAENMTAFTGQEVQLRCGEYECDDNGVRVYTPATGVMTVCPHPILPVKRIVNLDTGEHKVMLSYRRGETWRSAVFDKSVLASAQRIVQLSTWGIAVDSENARAMVTYLSTVENLNYDTLTESKSVGRLGWVESYGFSPYVDGLEFDGMDQYRHAFEAVHPQGSEDTWMDLARQVRAGPSTAVRIMLASSFASALVGPLNALPFMVHCWSNVSGIGKTVGLMLAASVWANPSSGEYLRTFNTTSVGIELMAGFCGSLPLCLDELCLKDGRREQFDGMIYNYCEGTGRARGNRTGGLQRIPTWRNCAISTGEEPLTSGNGKAGAINRVLDINAGNVRMFEDPRETVSILTRHYGHAGKRFVQMLMAQPDAFDQIRQWQTEIAQQMESKATDKQVLSASLVLAADRWVSEQIFNDGRALTVDEILPNLQTPDNVNVNKRCYAWLLDTVAANPSRFEARDDGTYVGECWGCIDVDGKRVYIIKSVFDRIMRDEGYNVTGFLAWAANERLIYRTDGKHMTVLKRLRTNSGVPARCVCLKVPDDSDAGEIGTDETTETTPQQMDGFTPVHDAELPF